MYNIFYKTVGHINVDGMPFDGTFIKEYRVYKCDNKNTLRRLKSHEKWTKHYPNEVCDRKVAIAERNRLVAEDEKRLTVALEAIQKVRATNRKA